MARIHEQSMNHIFPQKNTSASINLMLDNTWIRNSHPRISTHTLVSKALQWNPSKPDTVGPNNFVHYSEMSLMEGLCLFLSQVINILL